MSPMISPNMYTPVNRSYFGQAGGAAPQNSASLLANSSSGLAGQSSFSLAGGVPVQSNDMAGLMQQFMSLLQQMMSFFQAQAGGGQATGGAGTGGAGTGGQVTGGAGTNVPPQAGLGSNDYLNYVLGGSQGATANPDGMINGQYMQQNSRYANAGANEFDAVTAEIYKNQFKGYAAGMDIVYTQGQDSPEAIANNLQAAGQIQMTPEAEILSSVAAVYRGDLGGGSGAYNNPALGQLLTKWGRTDIASQPGVGQTDIESVGGVVRALNEEPDAAVRQSWLQEIYDFQNNTPVSTSGAVPQSGLGQYQQAVDIVQSGQQQQLINNYNQGTQTAGDIPPATNPPVSNPPVNQDPTTPVVDPVYCDPYGNPMPNPNPGPDPTPNPNPNPGPDPTPNPNPNPGPTVDEQVQAELNDPAIDSNFRALNSAERTALGLNDQDRAVLHMWGRQMLERGFQNGDYYLTNGANATEKALIDQFTAQEMAQFGEINGSALDEAFFALNDRIEGSPAGTTASKYAGRQLQASSGDATTFRNSISANANESGLSEFEQGVLRLWGHEPLMNGGQIDGSYLAFAATDNRALDSAQNSANNAVDGTAIGLLEADFMSDGVRNGDSLSSSFNDVLDKLYNIDGNNNGRIGTSEAQVKADATQAIQARAGVAGTTVQQLMNDVGTGMRDAVGNVANFVKDHPVEATVGAAGIAVAAAVCPFLGGLAATGAGIMAAEQQA